MSQVGVHRRPVSSHIISFLVKSFEESTIGVFSGNLTGLNTCMKCGRYRSGRGEPTANFGDVDHYNTRFCIGCFPDLGL